MMTTRNESSRPHGFKQQDCYLMDKLTENWHRQLLGEDCRHNQGRLVGGELAPATDALRLPVHPRRVKTVGTTNGYSRVENWHWQLTREDCRHNHVSFFVGARDLCWYFLMNAEESASVRNYRCSLHPKLFRVSYFLQGTEVLSSS
jgi:hypothetical protein